VKYTELRNYVAPKFENLKANKVFTMEPEILVAYPKGKDHLKLPELIAIGIYFENNDF
jgi:hypothetical protein